MPSSFSGRWPPEFVNREATPRPWQDPRNDLDALTKAERQERSWGLVSVMLMAIG